MSCHTTQASRCGPGSSDSLSLLCASRVGVLPVLVVLSVESQQLHCELAGSHGVWQSGQQSLVHVAQIVAIRHFCPARRMTTKTGIHTQESIQAAGQLRLTEAILTSQQ